MPGIAGIISKKPREWAAAQLARMLHTMLHEPSYVTGTFIDDSLGACVAWTARQNSFSAPMPLHAETGEVTLVFSGEEYPEPGFIAGLKQKGHQFETGGPSYLVHSYEDDPAFPLGLNGRFHGIVMDRRRGAVTLFNDRYGIHRIYYHESNDAFYFAAEAKAILAVCPELRRADARSLGEYVSCGCVLENRSLFQGIYLLPPASAWTFQGGSVTEKKAYFDPKEWENSEPLEMGSYYQQLRSVFSSNLPRYFNGHNTIGMSLTGGLDTRMILAWHQPAPGSMPCYSFGGMFRECEDVRLARTVAHACKQPFEVIPVGEEFLSAFPRYAERTVYLTDGCAPVRASSDLYVNARAAQIAPVRMTGNYGGEILRQLRAFKPVEPSAGVFSSDFLSHVHTAHGTYANLLKGNVLSFIAFRQVPWHHYSLLALEETQLTLRSPYLDNDLVRTVYSLPGVATSQGGLFKESDECVRLIADGGVALERIRTDRGLAGTSGSLVNTLTRGWLEFTFKAEYAYDYGMPQWLSQMDHSVSALHLERLFLGRHKFNHFRVWYRDQLSGYVREMLLDSRALSRSYVDRRGVEAVVNGHLAGGRNYTSEIHQLLTLELIHRLFIDSN
jgi:asparagine synthase (glutamine-hydrolysing)